MAGPDPFSREEVVIGPVDDDLAPAPLRDNTARHSHPLAGGLGVDRRRVAGVPTVQSVSAGGDVPLGDDALDLELEIGIGVAGVGDIGFVRLQPLDGGDRRLVADVVDGYDVVQHLEFTLVVRLGIDLCDQFLDVVGHYLLSLKKCRWAHGGRLA